MAGSSSVRQTGDSAVRTDVPTDGYHDIITHGQGGTTSPIIEDPTEQTYLTNGFLALATFTSSQETTFTSSQETTFASSPDSNESVAKVDNSASSSEIPGEVTHLTSDIETSSTLTDFPSLYTSDSGYKTLATPREFHDGRSNATIELAASTIISDSLNLDASFTDQGRRATDNENVVDLTTLSDIRPRSSSFLESSTSAEYHNGNPAHKFLDGVSLHEYDKVHDTATCGQLCSSAILSTSTVEQHIPSTFHPKSLTPAIELESLLTSGFYESSLPIENSASTLTTPIFPTQSLSSSPSLILSSELESKASYGTVTYTDNTLSYIPGVASTEHIENLPSPTFTEAQILLSSTSKDSQILPSSTFKESQNLSSTGKLPGWVHDWTLVSYSAPDIEYFLTLTSADLDGSTLESSAIGTYSDLLIATQHDATKTPYSDTVPILNPLDLSTSPAAVSSTLLSDIEVPDTASISASFGLVSDTAGGLSQRGQEASTSFNLVSQDKTSSSLPGVSSSGLSETYVVTSTVTLSSASEISSAGSNTQTSDTVLPSDIDGASVHVDDQIKFISQETNLSEFSTKVDDPETLAQINVTQSSHGQETSSITPSEHHQDLTFLYQDVSSTEETLQASQISSGIGHIAQPKTSSDLFPSSLSLPYQTFAGLPDSQTFSGIVGTPSVDNIVTPTLVLHPVSSTPEASIPQSLSSPESENILPSDIIVTPTLALFESTTDPLDALYTPQPSWAAEVTKPTESAVTVPTVNKDDNWSRDENSTIVLSGVTSFEQASTIVQNIDTAQNTTVLTHSDTLSSMSSSDYPFLPQSSTMDSSVTTTADLQPSSTMMTSATSQLPPTSTPATTISASLASVSPETTTSLTNATTPFIPVMDNPVISSPTTVMSQSQPVKTPYLSPSSTLPTPPVPPLSPSTNNDFTSDRSVSTSLAQSITPSPSVTTIETAVYVPNVSPKMTSVTYGQAGASSTPPVTPVFGVTTANNSGDGQPVSSLKTAMIIGSACAVFVAILCIIGLIVCLRKKRKAKSRKPVLEGDDLWVDLNSSNPAHQMPLPSLTTCPSSYDITATVKPESLYKAHFPFKAHQEGQLTLKEGDILQLVEKTDNGWWRGVTVKEGASGWFPSSFVTLISCSSDDLAEDKQKMTQSNSPLVCRVKPQRQVSSFQIKKPSVEAEQEVKKTYPVLEEPEGLNHVECWVNMAASVSMTSLPTTEMSYGTTVTDYNLAVVGHKFRAVYAYKPVCKGEMALKEGELIICKERDRNGWMLGSKPKTGEEGWFPAVYVDEVSCEDEIFGNNEDIPDTYDILDSNKLHKVDQCWIGIEHKAQYSYESTVPGDLNFEANDSIIVLQTLANGWWFGVMDNNCGWFPGSYVQMLEAEEEPVTSSASDTENKQQRKDQLDVSSSTLLNTSDISSKTVSVSDETNETLTVDGSKSMDNESDNGDNSADVTNTETNHKPLMPASSYAGGENLEPESLNERQPLASAASDPTTTKPNPTRGPRPNRQAPLPPPGVAAKTSTPGHQSHHKHVTRTESDKKHSDRIRRPARPAPPPPKRKDSKTSRKESIKSEASSYDPLVNKPAVPQIVAKPVLLIQGKKPKLKKIQRRKLDDKQLNPMIRPSTRAFLPKPSGTDGIKLRPEKGVYKSDSFLSPELHKISSHSLADDFSSELMSILNHPDHRDGTTSSQRSPSGVLDTLHLGPIFKDGSRSGRSSSRASMDSGSDSRFASPRSISSHPSSIKDHSPNSDHPELKSSRGLGHNLPQQRSLTPDSRRTGSPVLLTAGNLLQNVRRFNRDLDNASPSPSVDSDRSSVRSFSTEKGLGSTPTSTPSHTFGKRQGKRLKTLTTVPPPKVPFLAPNRQKANQGVNDQRHHSSEQLHQNGLSHSKDANIQDNSTKDSALHPQSSTNPGEITGNPSESTRRPSQNPRIGDFIPARDSFPLVPGKVSEIIQQINSLAPTQTELLSKHTRNEEDTEMVVLSTGKESQHEVPEITQTQSSLGMDEQQVNLSKDSSSHDVSTASVNGNMSTGGDMIYTNDNAINVPVV